MMSSDELPAMKLVVSVSDRPWTGSVYPTQIGRGGRQNFSNRDEFVAAVAKLAHWHSEE